MGLAFRMSRLQVFAFDLDPRARELCRRMAALNGVAARVHIAERCDHTTFQELGGAGTLVICDIEGGELELLDPARAPALADCDVLVECHDYVCPGVSAELAERFRPSHEVELIPNTWNNPNERPFLRGLRPIQKFLAVWEGRPGLTPWLFMTSHRSGCVEGPRAVQEGGNA